MVNIETHCHSHHSFDCNTSIESIVETCKARNIKGIVICDHDVCGITEEEEALFATNGIKLFKAIEFTTQTDAHVIGISPRIKELQKDRFSYSLDELIDELQALGAAIIIPHPNHGTGIVGNGKIPHESIEKALDVAHFVEKENFRYGVTNNDILKKYADKALLIGSDAHSAKNVGAFVNQVKSIEMDFLSTMCSGDLSGLKNEEHGYIYWTIKKIKKTGIYQLVLKIFPPEFRRIVKNKMFNK